MEEGALLVGENGVHRGVVQEQHRLVRIAPVVLVEGIHQRARNARAVALYFDDFKLGFVPRSENRIIYKLLTIGFTGMECKIQRVTPSEHPENQIGVIIHLIAIT